VRATQTTMPTIDHTVAIPHRPTRNMMSTGASLCTDAR
jgi:hypothetical protein